MEVTRFWGIVEERLKKVDSTAMTVDWLTLKPLIQQLNAANTTFIMTLICAYYKINNGGTGVVPYGITDMSGGNASTSGSGHYRVNYQYLPLPLQYIIKLAVDEMVNIAL